MQHRTCKDRRTQISLFNLHTTFTRHNNKPATSDEHSKPTTETRVRVPLPYINGTSEMTARLLRPFNIGIAHKPTKKLRTYFSKHKDKTTTLQKRNAIYLIPCKNYEQHYIGQTSKKIETRLTEHKNAINRHDLLSLPGLHTHNNGHTFNWTKTQLLDQAKTKHAREFKEAWHSVDKNTINRHIDISPVFLQLKNSFNLNNSHRRTPAAKNPATMTTTHPATTNQIPQSTKEPIRRSDETTE